MTNQTPVTPPPGTRPSLFATSIFLSNFYFWREAGYFDIDADLKPLLHTWSLAVEEQFYIFYPPLLILLHKYFKRQLVPALAGIAALSFVAGAYFAYSAPDAAFYLAPMRVWELVAGSLLALGAVPDLRIAWLRETLAGAGLVLIGIAVFAFDHDTVFPGVAAALPVVGTVLLVHAGQGGGSVVKSVLSLRPVVVIGLISYSLYLFHWPILVFYRHAAGESGDLVTRCLLMLAATALAWLSWRYFEQPFRRRAPTANRNRVFAGATAVAVVCLGAGYAGNAADGWAGRYEQRFDPVPVMAEGKGEIRRILDGVRCRVVEGGVLLIDGAHCDERADGRPKIAMIGDSHSGHLYPGLVAAFPDIDFQLFGYGGCRVLIGVNTRRDVEACGIMTPYVYERLLPEQRFDAVILASRWRKDDIPLLVKSIEFIKQYNQNIIVVGPVPRYKVNLPEILAIWNGESADRFFALNLDREVPAIDEEMRRTVAGLDVAYISVFRELCESGRCRTFASDDVPMQWDRAHLTAAGSRYVVDNILKPSLRHPPFVPRVSLTVPGP